MIFETERLIVRDWIDADLDPLAALNGDAEVMRYFPALQSRETTAAFISRCSEKRAQDGFCFSPVVLKETHAFIGFVGLSRPGYAVPLPFDPCIEIGWRLAKEFWGRGYASEAATAWLRFGFETLSLDEIVSFTAEINKPSAHVMARIGMRRDQEGDFMHPLIDADHPIAPHILYRINNSDWESVGSP